MRGSRMPSPPFESRLLAGSPGVCYALGLGVVVRRRDHRLNAHDSRQDRFACKIQSIEVIQSRKNQYETNRRTNGARKPLIDVSVRCARQKRCWTPAIAPAAMRARPDSAPIDQVAIEQLRIKTYSARTDRDSNVFISFRLRRTRCGGQADERARQKSDRPR